MGLETSHPVLGEYLSFTQNTESPALFHAWAFLSGVSAALGNRCWYRFGSYKTHPNMYVILCGPTSVRKSSAIDPIKHLLLRNTGVRFAPSDTGGQRQGLIEAMLGASDEEAEGDKQVDAAIEEMNNMNDIFDEHILERLGEATLDTRDPNSMYIAESKLSSILGENNTALLTFLQKLYDGEDYTYRLKKSCKVLRDSVLGMLAASTASSFAQSIPSIISAQDLMARCVFVYADETKIKKVPRPTLREELRPKFAELFKHIFDNMCGEFKETDDARRKFDEIYVRGITIVDQRFVPYVQRRQTHVQKVAMALAAARTSLSIEEFDVSAADALLQLTEDGMPYALGEYGLARSSAAKASLVEYLCSLTKPIPIRLIRTNMSRDLTSREFDAAIGELEAGNRIQMITIEPLGTCVIGVSSTDAIKKQKLAQHSVQKSLLAYEAELQKTGS